MKGRPYFSLPKGRKTREVPLPANLALRARAHFRRFPSTSCTLPWRNPEVPTTALEERQRKPITINLILISSHGNRIYYRTWNDRSWKRALATAGLIKPVGEKVRHDGNRIRRVPRYAAPRDDMFHVLHHTYASVHCRPVSRSSACPSGSGTRHRRSPSITALISCPARGSAGSLRWTSGFGTLPKIPEKSLRAWIAPRVPSNIHAKGMVRQGADMSVKYKETARGGLAVNIIEC
uniref:hypothetical protein n=1 Tax=Streptomyces corallincola TaxID=2851888 RepID=UPI001FE5809C|nr:hypothetical protein [Streptomyces corallincola]